MGQSGCRSCGVRDYRRSARRHHSGGCGVGVRSLVWAVVWLWAVGSPPARGPPRSWTQPRSVPQLQHYPDRNCMHNSVDIGQHEEDFVACEARCQTEVNCDLFVQGVVNGRSWCFMKRFAPGAGFDPAQLIPRPTSLTSLAVHVKSAARAGASVRLGISFMAGVGAGGLNLGANFQLGSLQYLGRDALTCSGIKLVSPQTQLAGWRRSSLGTPSGCTVLNEVHVPTARERAPTSRVTCIIGHLLRATISVERWPTVCSRRPLPTISSESSQLV